MDVIFPIKRPSDLAVWLHQSLLYMLTLIPLYSSLKQVQRTSDDPNSNIVAINYSESDPEDNNKETIVKIPPVSTRKLNITARILLIQYTPNKKKSFSRSKL